MRLVGVIILCLGLMVPAFLFRKQGLMVAAGLSWAGMAFWNRSITPEWGAWDIYELLFFVGVSMTFLCFIESMLLARKVVTPGEELLEEGEAYTAEFGEMMENVGKLRLRSRR